VRFLVAMCSISWRSTGWDLRGWRFSFAPLFAAQTGLMVTPRMITLVNVPLVWVAFPLIALQAKGEQTSLPCVLAWTFAVFNAVFAHILPALVTRSYNAGLLQSVFMSVIGIAILHRFARPIYGVSVILLGLVALGAAQHVFGVLLPFVLIDKFKVSAWIIVPCVVGSVWWVPSQIAKHGI
jgi:hypothetical protein